jgi:hypothetical protein
VPHAFEIIGLVLGIRLVFPGVRHDFYDEHDLD